MLWETFRLISHLNQQGISGWVVLNVSITVCLFGYLGDGIAPGRTELQASSPVLFCERVASFFFGFAEVVGEKSLEGFFLLLVEYCLNNHEEQLCQVQKETRKEHHLKGLSSMHSWTHPQLAD